MWVAYLAAVSFNFADGPLRIYQILATKHGSKGASGLPPTRRDLYAEPFEGERVDGESPVGGRQVRERLE